LETTEYVLQKGELCDSVLLSLLVVDKEASDNNKNTWAAAVFF
jgi:hypothetical protein